MKYAEAMEYIESLQSIGITPGLARIQELCRRLDHPQDKLRFVHIAGTNGKGSTLAYVSTICSCAGLRVGRYISPTIFEYRERIQVDGKMIGKVDLAAGISRIKEAIDGMKADGFCDRFGVPSPFEVETVLGFWYFVKKGCDLVVLETGMGGLGDATNLITTTEVAVLTSISMDHMAFLGKTLEAIAEQKAGIIKPGAEVVTISQPYVVMQVIRKACEAIGGVDMTPAVADPSTATGVHYGLDKQTFSYGPYRKLAIHLAGSYQIDNACLALEVIQALNRKGYAISEDAVREGLDLTRWPGRFTLLGKKPLLVADGAHNEDAARRLAESIDFYFTNRRIIYIMGMLRDKEYEKVIDLTAHYASQIFTVATPNQPRALPAIDLAMAVSKVNPHVTATGSIEEALEMSHLMAGKDDVILAFGSLSFLGQLMTSYENMK